jgi:hypothetical protein
LSESVWLMAYKGRDPARDNRPVIGRVSQSVLTRHHLVPQSSFKFEC